MPTNRRYLSRRLQAPIDPVLWAILNDAPLPADAERFMVWMGSRDVTMRPLWEEYRVRILAGWIQANPGTRPSLWWRYDAPRATTNGRELVEPRRQILGEGVPLHEVLNVSPSYHYGIPDWCGDPASPPIFESQHQYLKRHGLLQKGERKPRVDPFPSPARIERAT